MTVASKTMLIIGGGTALSIGFSAVAAGGLTWAVAGAGLQNAGMVAGHALDISGTVVEASGEMLQHLAA